MELTAAAEATTVLTETAAETTVLQQPEEVGATTVLSEAGESLPPRSRRRSAHSTRMWRWALAPALRSSSSFYHPSKRMTK